MGSRGDPDVRRGRRPAALAAALLAGLVALAAGCDTTSGGSDAGVPTSLPPTSTTTASTAPTSPGGPREIALRLERRVDDAATDGFAALVTEVLTDPRGWRRAGFAFRLAVAGADDPGRHPEDAPFALVLAEGPEVDALCRPYDTGGRFSCQRGPVVALNADRWRRATPAWTGSLDGYRRMLVNHEVGHLLGQHHPEEPCPGPGEPAPVMAQQSTELDGCRPNPWPLPWEVRCASLGLEPLAPGYEPAPEPRCGPDGPVGPGEGP